MSRLQANSESMMVWRLAFLVTMTGLLSGIQAIAQPLFESDFEGMVTPTNPAGETSAEYLVAAESILPEYPHLLSVDVRTNLIASARRFQLGSSVNTRRRVFTYHTVSGDRDLEFAGVKPCGNQASCWLFFNPDGSRSIARSLSYEFEEIVPSPNGGRVAVVSDERLRIYSNAGDYLAGSDDFPIYPDRDSRRRIAWLANNRLIYADSNLRTFVITKSSSADADRYLTLAEHPTLREPSATCR